MAVHQTADKITVITTAAIPEPGVAGMAIRKDTLKQQNADGKTADTALPEIVVTMMITGVMEMVVATAGYKDTALRTVTTKTVMEVIPAVMEMTIMMITGDTDTVDGSGTLKDMQKLHTADGKAEVIITVVVLTTAVIAAVVTDVMIVIMTIIKTVAGDVAGMVIQKDMLKQQNADGKIVDIKMNLKQQIAWHAGDLLF